MPGAIAFSGGEGTWYQDDTIFFATKNDNRIWKLNVLTKQLSIIYDDNTSATPILTGADNVVGTPSGDLFIAEDGGNMEIVVLAGGDGNQATPLLRVMNQNSSEIAGLAFSPDGMRMYFSSQRGTSGSSNGGITYEIAGPFFLTEPIDLVLEDSFES